MLSIVSGEGIKIFEIWTLAFQKIVLFASMKAG